MAKFMWPAKLERPILNVRGIFIFSTDNNKSLKYQNSRQRFQWERDNYVNRETDMTKITAAFRDWATAPNVGCKRPCH